MATAVIPCPATGLAPPAAVTVYTAAFVNTVGCSMTTPATFVVVALLIATITSFDASADVMLPYTDELGTSVVVASHDTSPKAAPLPS